MVWASLGTFLTSPAKEKHWLWLLHRKLLFKTADKRENNKRCRLCNYWEENALHFLGCRGLASVKNLIYQLLGCMGTSRSDILSKTSWLTGLDKNHKLIPEACRALHRIYITNVYRNMTLVITEKVKFNPWRVKQEICRDFMSTLLAYQQEKHVFSQSRRHTKLQHILPKAAIAQAMPLGNLDAHSGLLSIKPSISKILKRYKVWTEFTTNEY